MFREMKKGLSFLITFISFGSMEAQKEELDPMITDRPDATESASTVKPGYIQIETGAYLTNFEKDGLEIDATTYNTTLVRIGILDNLEMRLGWDFTEEEYTYQGQKLENILSGFSPLLFGTKIGITKEKNGWPEIGLIGHLQLPFLAASDYRPETTGVDFRFAFAHSLSDKSSLSYNAGVEWGNDSPEANYVYTISYGYSITDTFGFYLELYGDLPEDSSANHLWDAGLTYLISNNVQLDATIGSGITEGQKLLLSTGVSFRLPK